MKPKWNILSLMACFLSMCTMPSTVNAQPTTSFTYQGQLFDAGELAEGRRDFSFTLYDAPEGGDLIAGPLAEFADPGWPNAGSFLDECVSNICLKSIHGGHIKDFAIGTKHYQSYSVTSVKIANQAVNEYKIADKAVGTKHLKDASVTLAKLHPTARIPGPKGDKPAHQWSGTSLRFMNPDETWVRM